MFSFLLEIDVILFISLFFYDTVLKKLQKLIEMKVFIQWMLLVRLGINKLQIFFRSNLQNLENFVVVQKLAPKLHPLVFVLKATILQIIAYLKEN